MYLKFSWTVCSHRLSNLRLPARFHLFAHKVLLISQTWVWNNNSPWLSIVAKLTVVKIEPRRKTWRLGAQNCAASISNPHNLEAGKDDTTSSQRSNQTKRQSVCGCWDLQPCLYKAPLGCVRRKSSRQLIGLLPWRRGERMFEGARARGESEKEGEAGTTQAWSILAPLPAFTSKEAPVPFIVLKGCIKIGLPCSSHPTPIPLCV